MSPIYGGEMKFTKEEINLCKQITKKHRKDVKYGSWYIEPKTQKGVLLWDYEDTPYFVDDQCSDTVPLWIISDCLEFLRERRWTNYQFSFDKKGKTEIHIIQTPFEFRSTQEIIEQGTFLEVLLKAILAVLEESR